MGDLEFERVFQEFRGFVYPGVLKLRSSDVWFRNEKTGRVDHYQSSDIDNAEWISRARGYCLKIILNNGNVHRYDGFGDNDYEKLKAFVRSNYESDLSKRELSYKGWNWGKLKISGGTLDFIVDKSTAFEIPLHNVSQVNSGKNEITLEFHTNDDAETCLIEMRFHLPPPKESEKVEESLTDELFRRVVEKADIIQVTGDEIVEFKEMHCLQPRGRYDLKLYPTFIHFHGKTFDYKIPISTVYRMFLLPHRDNRAIFFVLNVDPPIKHGQTRYHFVILQFDKNSELTVELRLSEEELQKKYEGKLTKEMSGPEFEVIARLFKVLIGRKITVPGSFTSQSGAHTIGCSYKASVGFLYPLERGFMFVPRPAVHIRFDEISFVQFSRGTGAQRSFDFEIVTKQASFTFTSIEKDEYTRLFDFVVSKKLRVENMDDAGNAGRSKYEEFSSDDGGDHDAYLEKVKREGKKSGVLTINDFDDEDDEEDEDFMPPDSGSDVAEEYDSDPETTDSDYEDSGSGGDGSEGSATPESSSSSEEEAKQLDENGEETEESRRRREKKEKKKRRKEKERAWREKQKERHKKKSAPKRAPKEGGGGEKAAPKRKAGKDKNMPKRPPTAFFLFMSDVREQIKKDNPGIALGDIGRVAGEQWKKVSPEKKEEYQKTFEESKVAYKEAMEEYHRKVRDGEIVVDAPPAKKTKSAPKSKPAKAGHDSPTKASTSAAFKSAEFIESSGDNSSSLDSDSDDDKKPKKKAVKKEPKEEAKEEPSSSSGEEEDDDSGSDSD